MLRLPPLHPDLVVGQASPQSSERSCSTFYFLLSPPMRYRFTEFSTVSERLGSGPIPNALSAQVLEFSIQARLRGGSKNGSCTTLAAARFRLYSTVISRLTIEPGFA